MPRRQTRGPRRPLHTPAGGQTEILGLFNYGGTKEENDPRPCFIVEDASFSLAGIREIAFNQHTALNKVRETRAGETRTFDKNTVKEHGWIGWSLFSAWQGGLKTERLEREK